MATPLVLCGLLAAPMALADRVPQERLWALCGPGPEMPVKPFSLDPELRPGSTEIMADNALLPEEGLLEFWGQVEIIQDDNAMRADRAVFDRDNNIAEAEGQVQFWSSSLFWEGNKARLELDRDYGRYEDGRYQLLGRRGRGAAGLILDEQQEDRTRLRNVDYTTCDGEVPNWQLAAGSIRLNHATDRGHATNVLFKVRDVPVMYLPYISFPLSDKRKSGFLAPSVGTSRNSGIDLTVPYYWNIAPQQDATIAPRYMGDRGVMLTGEYRYLLPTGRGDVNLEFLPSDNEFNDDDRFLFAFNHEQRLFDDRGRGYITYNQVSDKEYFEDFGHSLSLASTRFLEQRAEYRHSGDRWWARARLWGYQTVDKSIPGTSRPYARLPQVHFSYSPFTGNRRLNLRVLAETTYFDREDSVTGTRIDLRPMVSYPIRTRSSFLEPRLTLQHTHYFLDDATGISDRQDRTLPIFSVDSGVFLERNLRLFDAPMVQTLEPRLFYLYVPKTQQRDIPVFDTGQFDFSFQQLFREDRFSGPDRVGDANQVTLALTSRLIDQKTGWERLRGSIGQIYHFADRSVTLPNREGEDDTVSELVAELATRISRNWQARADLQWDPNDSRTEKGSLLVRYRNDEGAVLNLGYRRRLARTDVEQTDLSFRWPLNPQWSLVGRWLYSLPDDQTLEGVGGVEYNSCCWGLRAVARRYLSSTDGVFDTAFFVQIEFKGLGNVGSRTSGFLREQIPGYSPDF